jgi:protein SCO1
MRRIITLVAIAAVVTACKSKTRYELTGEVVQRNPATSEITVKHAEIPGFMPAMTMPYKVASPLMAAIVEPGDKIAADIITENNGKDYWLDNLRVTDTSGRTSPKAAPAVQALPPGSRAPDLEMTNQDGKTIRLADFKGKALLVTFIYTRCPLPTFCPRLSSEFARIHDDLAKTPEDYSRTHLLAITLDPKYDTPDVLRKYGLAYLRGDASGFSHWDFAATSIDTLDKLAGAFGLTYQENQISHTMNIVLIAPDGTISKYWTTDWTMPELEDALRIAARKTRAR